MSTPMPPVMPENAFGIRNPLTGVGNSISTLESRQQPAVEEFLKTLVKSNPAWQGASVTFWDMIFSGFSSIAEFVRHLLQQVFGVSGGDNPIGAFINQLVDLEGLADTAWHAAQDATAAVASAVSNAVTQAVQVVQDGMNNIGQAAAVIQAAMSAAINAIIHSIFGDGGTKWGQEVLAAAGPVAVGYNDIPLGFGMPFSGKITDMSFFSSDHLSTGAGSKATVELRKNGTVIYTADWSGGQNSRNITGLNLSVNKFDRITFRVASINSQLANMSISVMGSYV